MDGDTVTKRVVELGIEESDRVEVIGGLTAGARVVVAGQGSLKDGTRVRVLGEPESDACIGRRCAHPLSR